MRVLLFIAIVLSMTVATADERRDDFAFRAPLKLDAGAALYEAPISLDVYRRAVYADLRDLRVFNGAGEIVPYSVRRPIAANSVRRPLVEVPIFPLRGDTAKALDEFRIWVGSRSTAVQIEAPKKIESRSLPGSLSAPLVGYLIDLRGQQESIVALELRWRDSMPQFATSVALAVSDDLASWRSIASDAPVVNLEFAGQQLRENRIELSSFKAKYLRLSWPNKGPALDLHSILVEPIAIRIEAQRQEFVSAGAMSGQMSGQGTFEFDLNLQAPVDRMTVRLPQVNSLVAATLWSRPTVASEWRYIAQATLYRLQHDDRELINSAVAVAPNTDRYWRVSGEQRGFGSGAPQLTVAWVPAQLVFLARGSPPFEVAVGSNLAGAAESPLTDLIGGETTNNPNRITPSHASLGEFVDAGGVLKLSQRPAANSKQWMLWSVLIAAVVLLAWMARRLMREMNAKA